MYAAMTYCEAAGMGEIRTFRDLDAWKSAMSLVESTYRLTAHFPHDEKYGLVSQMRRAAVSIPSNIAEGNAMNRHRWTIRFLLNAIGSSCELETQLEIAMRLCFCTRAQAATVLRQLDAVQKLLYGMKRERERRIAGGVVAMLLCVGFHVVR